MVAVKQRREAVTDVVTVPLQQLRLIKVLVVGLKQESNRRRNVRLQRDKILAHRFW